MPGRGSEARRGRGASGVFTGQRIRLELRGLERSRLASVLVPRAVGAVPLWVSPAEQPRSHAAGGLARRGRPGGPHPHVCPAQRGWPGRLGAVHPAQPRHAASPESPASRPPALPPVPDLSLVPG